MAVLFFGCGYLTVAVTVFVPARFDFRTGLPDASLFPHRAWRRVVARALRSREIAAGIYENPAGDCDLRAAIARHIGIARRRRRDPFRA
jgi:GntR family transcriptional regulator/MocR family aminotransferase